MPFLNTPAPPDLPLPLDSPERRRFPPLLRRAWYGLNQAFRRRIAHTGITPDQFTAMRTLMEGDTKGMTQRELSEMMTSDPNTVAALIERMEIAGWVQRKPHETDGRAQRIQLLPAGEAKYAEAREIAVELQAEIRAALPEEDWELFLKNLGEVAEACRRAARSQKP